MQYGHGHVGHLLPIIAPYTTLGGSRCIKRLHPNTTLRHVSNRGTGMIEMHGDGDTSEHAIQLPTRIQTPMIQPRTPPTSLTPTDTVHKIMLLPVVVASGPNSYHIDHYSNLTKVAAECADLARF